MNECLGTCRNRGRTLGNSRSRFVRLPRTRPDYLKGDKYCPVCAATWRGHAGLRCPCCMTSLRTTPRGSPNRRAFLKKGGWSAARRAA